MVLFLWHLTLGHEKRNNNACVSDIPTTIAGLSSSLISLICTHQITCQVEDGEQLNSAGYLVGYNIYVVTVIMLQAATGLVRLPIALQTL
jgi:hypothetical protein